MYGIAVVLLEPIIFPVLGAKNETWEYLSEYIFWTIGVGAVLTVINSEFAHLVRAEGYSKVAEFGVALGGILNILLDPIFIFVFDMQIEGATFATMLSTFASMIYFVVFLVRLGEKTSITINPKKYFAGDKILVEVVSIGLPRFYYDNDVNDFQYGVELYCCGIFQYNRCGNGNCKKRLICLHMPLHKV